MLKLNSKQKGITVGVITATMVAAMAAAGLWSRITTQTDAMAAPLAYQAEASLNLILAQVGQLQEAVRVADENTDIPWTTAANYNGKLSLANETQAYVSDFSVPWVQQPHIETGGSDWSYFKGFARTAKAGRLEWHFGSVFDATHLTAMAWLPVRAPALCVALNEKLGLGATAYKLSSAASYPNNGNNLSHNPYRKLPSGHVAYTYLLDSYLPGAVGAHLFEYLLRVPPRNHRASCISLYYGYTPALVVILYHGPRP